MIIDKSINFTYKSGNIFSSIGNILQGVILIIFINKLFFIIKTEK